ncbi:hypothetical protein J4441_00520 [Candidatus Micrarchaeota archaeon]|nr:hypothetical protein [Candidatus Micrarchaeota archaeon]
MDQIKTLLDANPSIEPDLFAQIMSLHVHLPYDRQSMNCAIRVVQVKPDITAETMRKIISEPSLFLLTSLFRLSNAIKAKPDMDLDFMKEMAKQLQLCPPHNKFLFSDYMAKLLLAKPNMALDYMQEITKHLSMCPEFSQSFACPAGHSTILYVLERATALFKANPQATKDELAKTLENAIQNITNIKNTVDSGRQKGNRILPESVLSFADVAHGGSCPETKAYFFTALRTGSLVQAKTKIGGAERIIYIKGFFDARTEHHENRHTGNVLAYCPDNNSVYSIKIKHGAISEPIHQHTFTKYDLKHAIGDAIRNARRAMSA